MKGIKVLALTTLIVSTLSFFSSTFAAEPLPFGWYVEGNVGGSQAQNKSYGSASVNSRNGFGWNVNLGYKFMPYFGAEIGYTNYAKTTVDGNGGVKAANDTHYSYDIAGKGILPVNDTGIEFFAKIGAARAQSHVTITNDTAANGLGIPTGTHNDTCLYYALGGDYSVMPNAAINLQWARTKADNSIGNLDLLSLGVTWLFG